MTTLLALHGFTGHPEDWRPVVEALPTGITLLAPALLGHDPERAVEEGRMGESATPFENEVDRLALWLTERLTATTKTPTTNTATNTATSTATVHLAGYSMGGRLAIGLLARHPERFAGATLIGVHPGLESAEARRRRRDEDETLARRLLAEGIESFVDFWQARPLFASQQRLDAPRLEAQRRRRLGHDPEGLARALRHLGPGRMPDYWSWLSAIEQPVTLLVGEEDGKFRPLAERMAAALPRARQVVVPGAAHNLLLEAPEIVARTLSEDLRDLESHRP